MTTDPAGSSSPQKEGFLNSKSVAFVAIISALGAVLSLSVFAVPLAPNVALDFSHIGTYIVAIGGGPILGAIAGALVSVIPAFRFANAAIIPGKMLCGFTVGMLYFLFKRIKKVQENTKLQFVFMIVAGIVGYLPEYVFTIWNLTFIVRLPLELVLIILAKAWIEIAIISTLTALIYSIPAIRDEVSRLVGKDASLGKIEYATTGVVICLTMLLLFAINFQTLSAPAAQDVFTVLIFVLIGIVAALVIFIFLQLRRKETPT